MIRVVSGLEVGFHDIDRANIDLDDLLPRRLFTGASGLKG